MIGSLASPGTLPVVTTTGGTRLTGHRAVIKHQFQPTGRVVAYIAR